MRKKFVAQQLASVSSAEETFTSHKFKDNREAETNATRWVITQYADRYQQETE
jgi:hypothetical protein